MPRAITEPNAGAQGSRVQHFRLNKGDLARWHLGPVGPGHRLPGLKQGHSFTLLLPLPRLSVAALCSTTADYVVDRLRARHGSPLFAHSSWLEFARQGHMGLLGAAEWAEVIGGRLEVESVVGEGTSVRVVEVLDDRSTTSAICKEEYTMTMIRVVLVDDHPIVRSGIRHLLEKTSDIVVVGETGEGSAAMPLIDELAPDVVVLDMEMPGLTGVEIARRLQAAGSPVRILALSAYDDEHYIIALLASGAAGYLMKDEALEKIDEAVRGVARGEEGWLSRRAAAQVAAWTRKGSPQKDSLTEREIQVLRLLVQGWTNGAVAEALDVSERTVRFHVTNICSKLGVATRGEAVAWATRHGLADAAHK